MKFIWVVLLIGALLSLASCNAAYMGGFYNGIYAGMHGHPTYNSYQAPVTCTTSVVGYSRITNCY